MTLESSQPILEKVGQISIQVRDLGAAIPFYRDKLGLKFLYSAPPKMAFFQCDAVMILVGEPESGAFQPGSSILYFDVSDIDAAHEELSRRGVRFVNDPHLVHRGAGFELWMSFFRDPDENMFALMSRKSTA